MARIKRRKQVFEIRSTKDFKAKGLNLLVYGQPGIGKTYLVSTARNPIVLSVEGGLLTLAEASIPYIEVDSFQTLKEIYAALAGDSEQFSDYDWICLDSLTEIAEICLLGIKQDVKHGMQQYQKLKDEVFSLLREFRDLKRHIYMCCKQDFQEVADQTAYFPMMPGGALKKGIAFDFDFVANLRWVKDRNSGERQRMLCFSPDTYHRQLKKRGERVSEFEPADLDHLVKLITNEKRKKK